MAILKIWNHASKIIVKGSLILDHEKNPFKTLDTFLLAEEVPKDQHLIPLIFPDLHYS